VVLSVVVLQNLYSTEAGPIHTGWCNIHSLHVMRNFTSIQG
jgi:hypothetical protein